MFPSTGLLIFRGKKQNFAGFSEANFAEKSADFAGFSQEKSQNLRNNRPISRDFGGKKSIFEAFPGANSYENRPISREILGGKLRQETISKKQPILLGFFFWQISLKSINFASE